MIEPYEVRIPEYREPHELPAMLEQAASDVAVDFSIWRYKSRRVLDTHQMPAPEEWLRLIASFEALEAVLCELEMADPAVPAGAEAGG